MTTARRNLLWPLMVIAVGCIWLLMVAGAFPDAIDDILKRSWPVLLVLFGVDVLVGRRRVRLARWMVDLNLLALGVMLLALVGIVWLAYRQQADELRTDNQVTFSEALPDGVERVRLAVDVERTAVTVEPAGDEETREIAAQFLGSRSSEVTMAWGVEGDTVTLTMTETYRDAIPKLDEYGRGTLEVVVPPGVVVEQLTVESAYGAMALDLLPLRVERVDVALDSGDLAISLPRQDTLIGELRVDSGDLTLSVPDEMALTLQAHGNADIEYDSFRYALLVGGQLERRNTGSVFQISLEVWLDDGATVQIIDLE